MVISIALGFSPAAFIFVVPSKDQNEACTNLPQICYPILCSPCGLFPLLRAQNPLTPGIWCIRVLFTTKDFLSTPCLVTFTFQSTPHINVLDTLSARPWRMQRNKSLPSGSLWLIHSVTFNSETTRAPHRGWLWSPDSRESMHLD